MFHYDSLLSEFVEFDGKLKELETKEGGKNSIT